MESGPSNNQIKSELSPCSSNSPSHSPITTKSQKSFIKNKRKNFSPRCSTSRMDGNRNTAKAQDIKMDFKTHSSTIMNEFNDSISAAERINNQLAVLKNSCGPMLTNPHNKLSDFAFKTMQELLNIYGLSISTNDIMDAYKQQVLVSNYKMDQQPEMYSNNTDNDNDDDINDDDHLSNDFFHHNDFRSVNDDTSNDRGSASSSNSANHTMMEMEESHYNSNEKSSRNTETLHELSSETTFGHFSPLLQGLAAAPESERQLLLGDYAKHLQKFASCLECNAEQCQRDDLREHYHCYDKYCYGRVLNKKDEIIRHLKWHRKRKESLKHGFLRFSSSDNCSVQFKFCPHNHKQTHYHCIHGNCNKVYVSTSDVQMHSNYHRKDSAIMQEGFQRFRATENCKSIACQFYGQRTTHFHCIRSRCQFYFKNKADMEKHKTFHIKDEQLARDGFKKFLKVDACSYEKCRFSQVCNHIHCTRENCSYVLHSSGQLLSHKRKHDRIDSELAYRRYKLLQKECSNKQATELSLLNSGSNLSNSHLSKLIDQDIPQDILKKLQQPSLISTSEVQDLKKSHLNDVTNERLIKREKEKVESTYESKCFLDSLNKKEEEQVFQNVTKNMNINAQNKMVPRIPHVTTTVKKLQPSIVQSDLDDIQDFDMKVRLYFSSDCSNSTTKINKANMGRMNSDKIKNNNLMLSDENITGDKNNEKMECFIGNNDPHLHCLIKGCEAVLPQNAKEITNHIKMHELTRGTECMNDIINNSNLMQITSIQGFFNRKRGRPPKNRVVEVYNNAQQSPQAIFTSFKLEKNEQHRSDATTSKSVPEDLSAKTHAKSLEFVAIYTKESNCSTVFSTCEYQADTHYHCLMLMDHEKSRCKFVTTAPETMDHHIQMYHAQSINLKNFQSTFQTLSHCEVTECTDDVPHYHCVKCNLLFNYVFEMMNHTGCTSIPRSRHVTSKEHLEKRPSRQHEDHETLVITDEPTKPLSLLQKKDMIMMEDCIKNQVVRAAGTFFPENSESNESEAQHSVALTDDQDYSAMNNVERPFLKLKQKHYQRGLTNQELEKSKKMFNQAKHQSNNSTEPTDLTKLIKNGNDYQDNLKNQQNALKTLHKIQSEKSLYLDDFLKSSHHINMLPINYHPLLIQSQYNSFLSSGMRMSVPSPKNFDQNLINSFLKTNEDDDLKKSTDKLKPLNFVERQLLESLKRKNKQLQKIFSATEDTDTPLEIKISGEHPKTSVLNDDKKRFKDDHKIPNGYTKFRFNEDCEFAECGYRNHQSHFHCCRPDCFYSFCDKTRFVQHTARHERLDKLMGDDFKQFRSNMRCGHDNCTYNNNLGQKNKSSHFHCLKCEYICSDTNKVVAHRRQHSKQDYIRMAGFRRVSNNEKCTSFELDSPTGECIYSLKQTHYHCLQCDGNVLSRAQLTSHRHRV